MLKNLLEKVPAEAFSHSFLLEELDLGINKIQDLENLSENCKFLRKLIL